MRFTCGNCGRAYVADDRIQGRSFKMPCRRCGQIISVEGTPSPVPAPTEAGAAAGPDPAIEPLIDAEPLPAPGKRRASLALLGVIILAGAGGFAWYIATSPTRDVPPQAVRPPEVSPAPVPAAPAPAEPPAPVVAAPAAPVEARLEAPPPSAPAKPADERRRPPPKAAAAAPATSPPAPAPAIKAAPRPVPSAPAAPRPDLPPLDEQQIQATLAIHAASFDGCVEDAHRDEPGLLASPRSIVVTMMVRPTGNVIYPTLDDAQLNGTALGACVKKQASQMVFPESGGENVRVRMPLLLGR